MHEGRGGGGGVRVERLDESSRRIEVSCVQGSKLQASKCWKIILNRFRFPLLEYEQLVPLLKHYNPRCCFYNLMINLFKNSSL